MLLKFGLSMLSALVFSCVSIPNSQNIEVNKEAEIEAQKIEGEKMMAAGYLPGRIVYSDLADDCEYTIQLKDDKRGFYYVDPLNLDKDFMKNEQTVWVKLTWLRKMSRCAKAVPVEIDEIKDRI